MEACTETGRKGRWGRICNYAILCYTDSKGKIMDQYVVVTALGRPTLSISKTNLYYSNVNPVHVLPSRTKQNMKTFLEP